MKSSDKIEVRVATLEDTARLCAFFEKAYGADSIFTVPGFLSWFFSSQNKANSLIALNSANEVVAHYGTISTEAQLFESTLPLCWGVNAYTLKEYRGRKIGNDLLELFLKQAPIVAVMGFSEDTAAHYRTLGFNVLPFKARNYFLPLKKEVYEIAKFMNVEERFLQKIGKFSVAPEMPLGTEIKKISLNPLFLDFNLNTVFTTVRSSSYLKWRYQSYPEPQFELWGIPARESNHWDAYIVTRKVQLAPLGFNATQIVDLYGSEENAKALLNFAVQKSIQNGAIYLDYSCVGNLYQSIFEKHGFYCLKEEDLELAPQLVQPLKFKTNNEYIGFYSQKHQTELSKLTEDNIYFNRSDSDRIRLVKKN